MSSNLFEIDSAMNMIKEDIIRDLSESVTQQTKERFNKMSTKEISFSERHED